MTFVKEKQAIDLVMCSYCKGLIDTRDDKQQIYRVTKGYKEFVYCCYNCFKKEKVKQ